MTTIPTAVRVDARDRRTRTLLQGLGIDILIAVAAALAVWLPDADITSREAWIVLGTALVKTVLQAATAYVMRLKLPPAETGNGV